MRKQEFVIHVKTNRLYEVICNATVEKDGTLAVVYRNVETGESYIRPASEFNDGRFVPASNKLKQDTGGGCSVCGASHVVNVHGTYWLCGPCVLERLVRNM